MAVRVQPSPRWAPAGSLWCDREGESSTQGFQSLLLSHCKEFSVQGCCSSLYLQNSPHFVTVLFSRGFD